MSEPGVFVVSLDTELAWGRFDTVDVEPQRDLFARTPTVIDDLLTLFDRYEIPATWALVAHLLSDCDGVHDEPTPSFDWVDWSSALPCRADLSRDFWYAPEILKAIREASVDHEIGLHGYTHMILGAAGCTDRAAAGEIDEALSVAEEHDIEPNSFVYPRNDIGHRDLLADRGFEVYRGVDDRWFERRDVPGLLRASLRYLEESAQVTPPAVTPTTNEGLVEIPGSQIFRPYHGGWQYTPRHSQSTRATKGLERAAETGEIFHLWFHPSNLATEPDPLLWELERILEIASELRDDGEIEICPMSNVATAYRNGRWDGAESR